MEEIKKKTRKSKFKIFAQLDLSKPTNGVVIIERRDNGNFMIVRRSHARKDYEIKLDDVASMVVSRLVKAEVRREL